MTGRSAGRSSDSTTLAGFLEWLAEAPSGTMLDAGVVHAALSTIAASDMPTHEPEPVEAPAATWRTMLWTVPAETRIGVREVAEAIGRPSSWVYRHTSEKSGLPRLPHRKLDGELLFAVGEVRAWLQDNEETVIAGTTSPSLSRRAS